MSFLRRTILLLAVVFILGAYSSVGSAAVYDWYMPQPMASADAAIAVIKNLGPSLSFGPDFTINDLRVDPAGLYVSAYGNGKQKQLSLTFGQLERFNQLYDPEGRYYSFLAFPGVFYESTLQIAGRDLGRKFFDAIATLALAQHAVLDPYYPFEITTGSGGYINKVLKQANVLAGAVVHSGDPTL